MAYNLYVYSKAFANLMGGESAGDAFAVDYLSDTIKAMLCSSSYTPNQDTDEVIDTPDAAEISGAVGDDVVGEHCLRRWRRGAQGQQQRAPVPLHRGGHVARIGRADVADRE